MPDRVRVVRGVAIRRIVTTQRRGARLTRAQMNPLGSDLNALFALPPLCVFNACNRLDVRASFFSHCRSSTRRAPGPRTRPQSNLHRPLMSRVSYYLPERRRPHRTARRRKVIGPLRRQTFDQATACQCGFFWIFTGGFVKSHARRTRSGLDYEKKSLTSDIDMDYIIPALNKCPCRD